MNTLLDDASSARGWRGSRDLWLAAAKEALLENGLDAVKIQPLAQRLNLSRTSFYWFFKDRNALLDALLDDWDQKNTGAFVTACAAYAETLTEAVLNLIVVFQDDTLFEPRLDFAIRGWAHVSDKVADQVNKADERRLSALCALFTRFGIPPAEADLRARTVYLTQIGYISLQIDEPLATRVQRVPGYVQIFCGSAPSLSELARFHARMGVEPAPLDDPAPTRA